MADRSFRVGAGILYDATEMYYVNHIMSNPPFAGEIDQTSPASTLSNPWAGYPGGDPFKNAGSSAFFPLYGTYDLVPQNIKPTYVTQYNASYQRQFAGNWLASVSYLGNHTSHLWLQRDLNPAVYMAGATTANTNQRRVFSLENPSQGQYLGQVLIADDGANASYNGLLTSVQHRFSHGFTLLANYTWSHCIDDGDFTGDVHVTQYQNPNNRRADRGDCNYDYRHVFNLSSVAMSPKMGGGYLGKVTGGWQIAPLLRVTSGAPFTVTSGKDYSLSGNTPVTDRPNLIDPTNAYNSNPGPGLLFLNPAAFGIPATGTYGNLGRDTFRGPAQINLDLSLVRIFKFTERWNLEARAESFNILNHTNFLNPTSNFSSLELRPDHQRRRSAYPAICPEGAFLMNMNWQRCSGVALAALWSCLSAWGATSPVFNVMDYGAKKDGKTDVAPAINAAIAAAKAAGGGTVVVPAGQYTSGPIELISNLVLYFDAGAVVRFPAQRLPFTKGRQQSIEALTPVPLIGGHDLENVTVGGRGTLMSDNAEWMKLMPRRKASGSDPGSANGPNWEHLLQTLETKTPAARTTIEKAAPELRPSFIRTMDSSNVLIEGLRFIGSPMWTVHLLYSDNVTVRDLIIETYPGVHTDGIAVDSSRNVRISNCYIDTGDDGIVIKAGKDADGLRVNRPTENVSITNCTVAPRARRRHHRQRNLRLGPQSGGQQHYLRRHANGRPDQEPPRPRWRRGGSSLRQLDHGKRRHRHQHHELLPDGGRGPHRRRGASLEDHADLPQHRHQPHDHQSCAAADQYRGPAGDAGLRPAHQRRDRHRPNGHEGVSHRRPGTAPGAGECQEWPGVSSERLAGSGARSRRLAYAGSGNAGSAHRPQPWDDRAGQSRFYRYGDVPGHRSRRVEGPGARR